jgi:hypothetical protein
MPSEGFFLSANQALVFFRWCIRYKVIEREAKIDGLRRLVAKHKAKYLRDAEDYMAKAILDGKKILKVEGGKDDKRVD